MGSTRLLLRRCGQRPPAWASSRTTAPFSKQKIALFGRGRKGTARGKWPAKTRALGPAARRLRVARAGFAAGNENQPLELGHQDPVLVEHPRVDLDGATVGL